MPIAILEYDAGKGRAKRFKVRPGQSVLVGASNSSDIKLNLTEGVAAQHCEVTYASGTLAIKNLTEGRYPVRVNGTSVNRQKLVDGDQVEIGDNRLVVVLQSQPAASPSRTSTATVAGVAGVAGVAAGGSGEVVAAAPPTEQPPVQQTVSAETSSTTPAKESEPEPASGESNEADKVDYPEFEICGNGLRVARVESFEQDLLPRIGGETTAWGLAILVNHRASKLSQPAPETENLLAQLPPDLAAENDLYLPEFEDQTKLLKAFGQYADVNAATMVLGKAGKVPSSDDLKLLAAWFLTPSHLRFNLVNGTALLLQKIYEVVDAVVIRHLDTPCDMCLINDGTVTDWDSFVAWLQEGTNDADH